MHRPFFPGLAVMDSDDVPVVGDAKLQAAAEILRRCNIPLRSDAAECSKIRQLSTAEILAETIRRISREDSVSSLFME